MDTNEKNLQLCSYSARSSEKNRCRVTVLLYHHAHLTQSCVTEDSSAIPKSAWKKGHRAAASLAERVTGQHAVLHPATKSPALSTAPDQEPYVLLFAPIAMKPKRASKQQGGTHQRLLPKTPRGSRSARVRTVASAPPIRSWA